MIRWTSSGESSGEKGLAQMASLLRELTSWPLDEFATSWWPGDYRLLKLTSQRPVDVNAEITCHASAYASLTHVTVTAWVRSEGKSRALTRSEGAALVDVGFGIDEGGRGELIHVNTPGQEKDLAARVLQGVANAFGTRGSLILRYHVESGSRLDSMPVFQDIREHELLSLLIAAGFDARGNDAVIGATGNIPTISVRGTTPYLVEMIEPVNDGYLTLRLEARFAGAASAAAVEAHNRASRVGAASLENGEIVVRHEIIVTGGISHAGLRDRFDEWGASLASVAQEIAHRQPTC
jgi:hypothetical protein